MEPASTVRTAPPAAMVAAGNAPRKSSAHKSGKPSARKVTRSILIVEDELWAALDMEWVIGQLGHSAVGPAATAEEALMLAAEARPDLVLMDIRLANDTDGITAAIEIRLRFDIPSLFVSAHGDAVARHRAAAAAPVGFIEKPFTPDALSQAIKSAFEPDRP